MENKRFSAGHVPHYSKILLSVWLSPHIIFLTIFAILLLALSMVGFHYYETPVNPNINNIEDVLWWGVSTFTAVGYGDVYPVTGPGKILGSVVMILGVSMFLGVTSVWVTNFLSKIGAVEYQELNEIKLRLDRIERLLQGKHESR